MGKVKNLTLGFSGDILKEIIKKVINMGFLKNAAIVGVLSVAFLKGCEYLITDKFKQITGTDDPENTQIDTQERFRGYGQEFRKGVEGFVEGVATDPNGGAGNGVFGDSKRDKPNPYPRLEEMCLEEHCP